jgi:hypothetical protein
VSHDDPARLKDLLGPVGERLGLKDPAQTGAVWARWERIVGPGIASHCRPSSLRDGLLKLRCDSATWATEVGYLAEEIQRKVNQDAGSELVREVRVWVGPASSKDRIEEGGRWAPKGTAEAHSKGDERPRSGDPREALGRAREAWARHRRRDPR